MEEFAQKNWWKNETNRKEVSINIFLYFSIEKKVRENVLRR